MQDPGGVLRKIRLLGTRVNKASLPLYYQSQLCLHQELYVLERGCILPVLKG
jgi:hypothetical protein